MGKLSKTVKNLWRAAKKGGSHSTMSLKAFVRYEIRGLHNDVLDMYLPSLVDWLARKKGKSC